MLTYEKLSRKPHAFRSMTGPTIEEFDQVYLEAHYCHPEVEAEHLKHVNK